SCPHFSLTTLSNYLLPTAYCLMEWCLHISGADDLQDELSLKRLATLETSGSLQPTVALAARLIEEQFGEIAFTRCVFGNEFCEHLIPSPAALEATLSAAQAHRLNFTFLTPYVSNAGLAELRALFAVLVQHRNSEVVFNDWGVLNLLRRDFPQLVPVQGRLLNKSL